METKAQEQLRKTINQLEHLETLMPDEKRRVKIAELERKYNLLTPYYTRYD